MQGNLHEGVRPLPMWWAFCMQKTNKHLQTGRVGELLIKAKFIENGFDVFSTEVDDKGVDLVVKNEHGKYFDIQVKTSNQTYVFMRKEVFKPCNNLYVALLILDKQEKQFFVLIPSLDFKNKPLPTFLKDNDYEGKKSQPEYGIDPSDKHIGEIIKRYAFSKIIGNLKDEGTAKTCLCNEPLCGKCLGVNCKDENCITHTKENKDQWKRKREGGNANNSVVHNQSGT